MVRIIGPETPVCVNNISPVSSAKTLPFAKIEQLTFLSMMGAINKFDTKATQQFCVDNGLKIKVERGKRVFPESDKASDVIKVFQKKLDKNNVEIKLNHQVTKLYRVFCQVFHFFPAKQFHLHFEQQQCLPSSPQGHHQ